MRRRRGKGSRRRGKGKREEGEEGKGRRKELSDPTPESDSLPLSWFPAPRCWKSSFPVETAWVSVFVAVFFLFPWDFFPLTPFLSGTLGLV